jgi:hypothetical protein
MSLARASLPSSARIATAKSDAVSKCEHQRHPAHASRAAPAKGRPER